MKQEKEARIEEEREEKRRKRQEKRRLDEEARKQLQKEKSLRKHNLLSLKREIPPVANNVVQATITERTSPTKPVFEKGNSHGKLGSVKKSLVQNVLVKMSDGQLRHCIKLEDGTIVPIERGSSDSSSHHSKIMSDIMMTQKTHQQGGNRAPSNVPVISLKRKPPSEVVTTNYQIQRDQIRYTSNGHNRIVQNPVARRPSYPTLGSVVVRHSNLTHHHSNPRFVRIPQCGPVVVGHRPSVIRAYKPRTVNPLNVQQRPVVVGPNNLHIVRHPSNMHPVRLQKQLYTLPRPITSQQIVRPVVSHYNNQAHSRSSSFGEQPASQQQHVRTPNLHSDVTTSSRHFSQPAVVTSYGGFVHQSVTMAPLNVAARNDISTVKGISPSVDKSSVVTSEAAKPEFVAEPESSN